MRDQWTLTSIRHSFHQDTGSSRFTVVMNSTWLYWWGSIDEMLWTWFTYISTHQGQIQSRYIMNFQPSISLSPEPIFHHSPARYIYIHFIMDPAHGIRWFRISAESEREKSPPHVPDYIYSQSRSGLYYISDSKSDSIRNQVGFHI
jgi:hypothetical protein